MLTEKSLEADAARRSERGKEAVAEALKIMRQSPAVRAFLLLEETKSVHAGYVMDGLLGHPDVRAYNSMVKNTKVKDLVP